MKIKKYAKAIASYLFSHWLLLVKQKSLANLGLPVTKLKQCAWPMARKWEEHQQWQQQQVSRYEDSTV